MPSQLLVRFTCVHFFFWTVYFHPFYQVFDYFRCMWMTPIARATCKNEGVSFFSSNYDSSVTAAPIVLTFRIHCEGSHLVMRFHVPHVLYYTCALAMGVLRSRERLNRLRSNLVQWGGPGRRVACRNHLGLSLHVCKCRVTVSDLKNGWWLDRLRTDSVHR